MHIVVLAGRYRRQSSKAEGLTLHPVGNFGSLLSTIASKNLCQHFLELFLGLDIVIIREVFWQNLIEEDTTKRRLAHLAFGDNPNRRLQMDDPLVVGELCLVD